MRTKGEYPSPDREETSVRCFQCGLFVARSGWCENCHRFPSNIGPRRTDEFGHAVALDGFCHACKEFVASRLEFTPRGWTDTRTVQTLLAPGEFQAKMAALLRTLDGVKSVPDRPAGRATAADRELLRQEWAAVKRRMREANATRGADAVPF